MKLQWKDSVDDGKIGREMIQQVTVLNTWILKKLAQ